MWDLGIKSDLPNQTPFRLLKTGFMLVKLVQVIKSTNLMETYYNKLSQGDINNWSINWAFPNFQPEISDKRQYLLKNLQKTTCLEARICSWQGVRWSDNLSSTAAHFKNSFFVSTIKVLTFLYPILILTMWIHAKHPSFDHE